jgi:hypothetical protein
MMKKIFILLSIFIFLIVGCTTQEEPDLNTLSGERLVEVEALKANILTLESKVLTLEEQVNVLLEENTALKSIETVTETTPEMELSSMSLLMSAQTVIEMLEVNDMTGVASFVDPTLGLRFSPYSVIDLVNDLVFTPAQVSTLWTDPTLYTWGTHASSGDPITMLYSGYHGEYVYDQNYSSPHMIGNNVIIGTGNMINTVVSAYPTASFVEYHFTGFNPSYSGMDWVSVRLIFENISGVWKLIGIEHDAWTS